MTAQQQQRVDKEMQAKIDETVAAYIAAVSEGDVAKRRQLLEKAWATDGVYTDPTAHVEGREALVQHISGFLKSLPGHRVEATSRPDVHHNALRFSWRLTKPDGAVVTEGIDFGMIDASGRLTKIIGFFGPFPTLPPVKFSSIADSALRRLPHAMASDRRVICAALHQSTVRAISDGAAR